MKSEGKKYKKERKLFLKYGKPTVQREQQNKEEDKENKAGQNYEYSLAKDNNSLCEQ